MNKTGEWRGSLTCRYQNIQAAAYSPEQLGASTHKGSASCRPNQSASLVI